MTADAFNPATNRLVQEAQAISETNEPSPAKPGNSLESVEQSTARSTGEPDAVIAPAIPSELATTAVTPGAALVNAELDHDKQVEQTIFATAENAAKDGAVKAIVELEKVIGQLPIVKTE